LETDTFEFKDIRELSKRNYSDRWYNGFSPKDRMLLSKPQRAERYSRGNNPMICCMTGFSRPDALRGTGYMFTHLEDYQKPLLWYPMSKRAHTLLHRRFVEPEKWMRFVAKHYVHGAWFTLLTMNVRDMYEPYCKTYPQGLPSAQEVWPDYADECGVKRLYLSLDVSRKKTS